MWFLLQLSNYYFLIINKLIVKYVFLCLSSFLQEQIQANMTTMSYQTKESKIAAVNVTRWEIPPKHCLALRLCLLFVSKMDTMGKKQQLTRVL